MPDLSLVGLGAAGLIAGLGLLARGFLAQRAAARISDIGSSPIGLLAAGEVRITGEAVAAGITLTTPVRGRQALYYRALGKVREGEDERTLFDEQRGVGFFIKDASGEVRVFPRGARWEVPLDEPTNWAEGRAGLGRGLLLPDAPAEDPLHPDRDDLDFGMPTLIANSGAGGRRSVTYREGRLEPGDTITIVGRAVPFRDLADPTEVDQAGDVLATLTGAVDANHLPDLGALEDPEVAASYARALEEGTLAASPAEAWGNAAIEGFGIGRPVRPPDLDPGIDAPGSPAATPPQPATGPLAAAAGPLEPILAPMAAVTAALPGVAIRGREGSAVAQAPGSSMPGAVGEPRRVSADVERSFEFPPDRLVIAAGPDVPLLIASGTPGQAAARHEGQFLLGLLGAVLAIGSAVFLAVAVSGTLRI